MSFIYVLLALLMLGVMVTVHEWGHFIAARMTGIPVQEFSIGFGPKIKQWKGRKHDTVFSVRLIPAGGYCAFYGEDDPDSEADKDPRAMRGFAVWKRLITVLMGPCMNFVLAFLVGLFYFWIGGIPQVNYGEYMVVSSVNPGSAAELAGFQPEDKLISVNGVDAGGRTADGQDYLFRDMMNEEGRKGSVIVTVERGGQEVPLTVTPQADSTGRMMIGIAISPEITDILTIHPTLIEAARYSAEQCVYEGGLILQSLGMLFNGQAGLNDMSGPVGVVSLVAKETETNGLQAYIMLLIFISVNLGLVNLLPIPGLDGARILLLLGEAICRKPLPRKVEATINLVGFAVLMLLFVVLTFQDVRRLFGGS